MGWEKVQAMVFVMVKNKHHNVMENQITTNLENKYWEKKQQPNMPVIECDSPAVSGHQQKTCWLSFRSSEWAVYRSQLQEHTSKSGIKTKSKKKNIYHFRTFKKYIYSEIARRSHNSSNSQHFPSLLSLWFVPLMSKASFKSDAHNNFLYMGDCRLHSVLSFFMYLLL